MELTSRIVAALPADWASRSGPAPGTEGLSGAIRLRYGETVVGVLKIADGQVALGPDDGADVTLTANTAETLVGLLGGEVHPIVARLQNRVAVDGDTAFAIRVLLGLREGSPWRGLTPRS
jgi:hypothetical protein